MDNHNTKLLNYLYKNSQMGVQTISRLLDNIRGSSSAIEAELDSELAQYKLFQEECVEHIKERGGTVKPISKYITFMSNTMIDFKVAVNKSPSYIAEMMMQGTTMGIIEATKCIRENRSADPAILSLANDILHYENAQFINLMALL